MGAWSSRIAGFKSRTSVQVFAPIALALVIISGAACYLSFEVGQRSSLNETRQDLRSLATILASEIDVQAHEKLLDPGQMKSVEYKSQIEQLAKLLRKIEGIRFIYTLRSTPEGYAFVLDPTPAGDHNQDGIDDKSYLMDPYQEITPIAKDVFRSGIAAADETLTSDRWGTFLSAYAPLKDSTGKVVAILGIDRDQSTLLAQQAQLKRESWLVFGLVSALGLIFSGFLTWRFYRQGRITFFQTGSSKYYIRMAAIEMLLFGVACASMVLGILGHVRNGNLVHELNQITSDRVLASNLESDLREYQRNPGYRLDVAEASSILNRLDRGYLASLIDTNKNDWKSRSGEFTADMSKVTGDLVIKQAQLKDSALRISARISDQAWNMMALFVVATLCALVSLTLIRFSLRQQIELKDALAESDSAAARYQHVVEHLPIGLYTYADRKCDFANAAWDKQVRRGAEEDRTAAFVRSIHPADRDSFIATIALAEANREPYSSSFRINSPTGEVSHIESRGVPVFGSDGEFKNMLGFSIDVSESIQARKALTEKNVQVEAANQQLHQALAEIDNNFEATVRAFVMAVEAKDPYTAGHSERVMGYSVRIGYELGLTLQELKVLQMGTLIHDVGKIGIPDAILTKPSGLTDEEFKVIAQHPEIGHKMIEGIPLFAECIPIVRSHHERLDGSGYPDGLKGDEIPLCVRIAAVADAFDAITSTRAYRSGRSTAEAIAILQQEAEEGKADPVVVNAFAKLLEQTNLKSQIYPEAA